MTCFLTSRHNTPGISDLNPANGFAEELRRAVKRPCKALIVCSSPDDTEKTELYSGMMVGNFRDGGLDFSEVCILDRRNQDKAGELVTGRTSSSSWAAMCPPKTGFSMRSASGNFWRVSTG